MMVTGLDNFLTDASAWVDTLAQKRAAFLGCGDSLAASRPAENLGHRVMSAGDVAWGEQSPQGVDLSIALSWSGRTGATIRAAETVKASGQPVWAITSNPLSPLAQLADRHLQLPGEAREEDIPTWGFALHSLAVLTALGIRAELPKILEASGRMENALSGTLFPAQAPAAITVTALPDSHATAEFWSLKLIEATGVTARVAPLEEVGHVDYFLGPQPHLVLIPLVGMGHERATQLGEALERNGHIVLTFDVRYQEAALDAAEFGLALSLAGKGLARAAAKAWGREYFRGGLVDMSAKHIQVPMTS
ncbi:MAG: SIS domain-containing protein [Terrimesophilobacter sp.]